MCENSKIAKQCSIVSGKKIFFLKGKKKNIYFNNV